MENNRLKYFDEAHLYLLDDLYVLPSVTQILHKIFPNKYKDIPKWILEKKADYGSQVHKIIEDLENGVYVETPQSFYIRKSINQYYKLKKKYNINVLEQEQMIHYERYYAGRFDMIASINGDYCLCDIKTTAELDKEYLSWQLSLYEMAYGKQFDKLYCIWLPKGALGKLVEIERIEKEKIIGKLEEIGVI